MPGRRPLPLDARGRARGLRGARDGGPPRRDHHCRRRLFGQKHAAGRNRGGIHDHIAGDGRELVLTDESAVTIAAEDGRSVRNLDISPFVRWLPGGDVRDFSTDHASGSTSQAANVVEAVSHGASLLLIDEDRSATNFMIRDPLMKALVEKEPLTPFTDRVRELYEDLTVSTILVIGGSGEYLTPADRVYRMEDFVLRDVTAQAKSIARPGRCTAAARTAADTSDAAGRPLFRIPRRLGQRKADRVGAGFHLRRRRARRRPRPARRRQRTPAHRTRFPAAAPDDVQRRPSGRSLRRESTSCTAKSKKTGLIRSIRAISRPADAFSTCPAKPSCSRWPHGCGWSALPEEP